MHWTITVQDRDIGHAALRHSGPLYADYEIAIDAPANRSRGVGTDSTRLVLGYVFATLRLRRVRLLVDGRNRRARACYARCDFVPLVRRRDWRCVTLTMVCPNPALPQPVPLCRTLQRPAGAMRGRRLQLTRADLAFLGVRLGEPVAIAAAADELLITAPHARAHPTAGEAIVVDLSTEEHDQLTLTAAHLGLTPATMASHHDTRSLRL